MKTTEQIFNRPITVIQFYCHHIWYKKEEKATIDHKSLFSWNDIYSKLGYIKDGLLYLPENIISNTEFSPCDLIIIADEINPSERLQSTIQCLRTSRANAVDIFNIRKKEQLELHLAWNYFSVGEPARDNMKLCDLHKEKSYEIQINGKTDFSLTGRRPRQYLEQSYIIETLGIFDRCQLFAEHENPLLKTVPEERKLIDLRKMLW